MALTIRTLAAALGISKSQAARDKADGMPADDLAAARAWRDANRDPSRTVTGRIDRPRADAPPPASPAGADSDADDDVDEEDAEPADDGYRQARTEREQIRRDRERLELDRARGQSIDVAEAARMAYTAFRALRDQAFNLPPRLATQLAVESDPLRVEAMLQAELADVFGRFDEARLLQDSEDDDDAPG